MEKACYSSLRQSQVAASDLIRTRASEEKTIIIEPPVFDRIRPHEPEDGDEDLNTGRDSMKNDNIVDYLTPFLQGVKDPNNLSREEATKAREACLRALKVGIQLCFFLTSFRRIVFLNERTLSKIDSMKRTQSWQRNKQPFNVTTMTKTWELRMNSRNSAVRLCLPSKFLNSASCSMRNML